MAKIEYAAIVALMLIFLAVISAPSISRDDGHYLWTPDHPDWAVPGSYTLRWLLIGVWTLCLLPEFLSSLGNAIGAAASERDIRYLSEWLSRRANQDRLIYGVLRV